jgi:hypothetical protein
MKSILVVTKEDAAYPLIASTYNSGFTVERAIRKTERWICFKKNGST